MRIVTLLLSGCLGFASSSALADIYGHIDAQGVAHFSTEKLDERYQLFLRGDESFDSSTLTESGPITIKPALLRYLSEHPNLKKYEPLMRQAGKEFSVDPALLKAVMAAESGFNPNAVSPKGAVGLMQIMPATAERYGLRHDQKKSISQKLTDPKTNIRLGARYLRDLHKLFPNQPQLILASYNAGEGAVKKYKNTIPPYPETRNYVQVVTQFHQLYKPVSFKTGGAVFSGSSTDPKRISMTIPGRRNMPAPATQTE
ncbi:MAG: lytic transglycosylase [Burkholderiales bacterium RIFCSPLOWO2_02_FULL_57_36]|nr:MAG: lytic transglycosylase [Burkholderiales bacterium RIFCSPLOWO2_02_FULL_57_36]